MYLQRDFLSPFSIHNSMSGLEGLLLTADDGVILQANRRANELLALKNAKPTTNKIHQLTTFYSADSRAPLHPEQTPFYTALQEKRELQEIVLGISVEDQLKWLLFNIHPLKEKDYNGLLISFMDVSGLVSQNQDVKDKQQQLQLLVASLNDIVFEVTDEGVFKNYWTNDPSLLFYRPDEFLDRRMDELFPPHLSGPAIQLIQKALKLEKEFKMEFQSPFKQHKNKWYSLQVKPIHRSQNHVALVVSDITEQIESTEKIRFNEHKFNQAFHFSGLGMALTDLRGFCIESNNTLTKILGYTQTELSKMKFSDYTHPDDTRQESELRTKLVQGKVDSFTLQKRYKHKLGHFVWCSVTISAVFDHTGSPLFLIVQVQDISESKRNIEILKRQKMESELLKIDLETKVRQMEEFAGILAHDLKGPLSNMQMLIDEIKVSRDEKIKSDFLDLLKASTDQLSETLHDLGDILDLRSNTALHFEKCDFLQVYLSVKHQLIEEIQHKNAFISVDFRVESIHYPKIYLESILVNLISNALRFTAQGRQPHIEIQTHAGEGGTVLTVKDNGLGINLPKYKSQLFMFKKIFHRGIESKGVGLFLIRHQIESLGGKIDVHSEPDKGSIFSVNF